MMLNFSPQGVHPHSSALGQLLELLWVHKEELACEGGLLHGLCTCWRGLYHSHRGFLQGLEDGFLR